MVSTNISPSTQAASWPPPATPGEPRVLAQTVAMVQVALRPVQLWGKRVWIDRDNRVFCPCCSELLTLDVLGSAEERDEHPVGPFAQLEVIYPWDRVEQHP